MTVNRRAFLAGVSVMLAEPAGIAWAEDTAARFKAQEATIAGRVGVFAKNLKTGKTIAWRADERFSMCSTFKASLAACVLARVDRGTEKLDRVIAYDKTAILEYAPAARANLATGAMSIAELCKAAVELSDNTCANLLLAQIGGPTGLTEFWRVNGDAVTRLDHEEPVMSRSRRPDDRDTTAPAAMAEDLRRFVLGDVLSANSRELLTSWMRSCSTGTDLLRAGLPKGWAVADKSGNNGKDMTSDIAVAWPGPGEPIVIATYIEGGTAPMPKLRQMLAEIGAVIGTELA